MYGRSKNLQSIAKNAFKAEKVDRPLGRSITITKTSDLFQKFRYEPNCKIPLENSR